MTNERLSELLAYLHELRQLNEADYRCNTEIGEAIEAIREELFRGNGEEIQLPYFHGLGNANNPTPTPSFNLLHSHSSEELLSEVIKRGDHEIITAISTSEGTVHNVEFSDVRKFGTVELTKELDRRAENPDSGVKVHKLAPHGEHATLQVNGYNEGYQETITGAHIYVVTD